MRVNGWRTTVLGQARKRARYGGYTAGGPAQKEVGKRNTF